MALGKAIVAGAAAALALPWLLAGQPGALAAFVRASHVRIPLVGTSLAWSWTLFCLVTLIAWGFLAWADR